MLHLHESNRIEALAAPLLAALAAHDAGPGERVFEAVPVVVPHTGWRRALALQAADALGVCAQIDFVFLAQWLWRQAARHVAGVPERSPWAPEALAWRIDAAWAAPADAAHPRLQRWLDRATPVARHALAQRVAALFDRYATERPEALARWAAGAPFDAALAGHPDHAWQAALWRRLLAEVGTHPVQPLERFVAALDAAGDGGAAEAGLPAALHVFSLPTMPVLHRRALVAVARHCDVHIYTLNPCHGYWHDLVSPRRMAWLQSRGRAGATEAGAPLLTTWGGALQAHLAGLLADAGNDYVEHTRFEPPAGSHLLARLQAALLEGTTVPGGPLAAGDRSIELHACHSRTRELEVLHGVLLQCFADDPALSAGSVLVVTPDLEADAPLIDAVFGTMPEPRRLPYVISGLGRSRADAPAAALLQLLALVQSRCTAPDVFALLQRPEVARRFGVDADALADIARWIAASGIRWGLDAGHRAQAVGPADERHTWADGLSRLFLGFAMEVAQAPVAGRLPAGNAIGSRAAALGALQGFVDALAALQRDAAVPRGPAAWADWLGAAVRRFIAPADDDGGAEREALRALHQAIAAEAEQQRLGGADAPGAPPLALPVVAAALQRRLDDPARGGVPTGAITFTSMSSLRGLAFEVVCAIGLDFGRFPASDHPAEFDLAAAAPRAGDRSRRADDRHAFLDLVLAARRRLVLCHTGRSARDNQPLPPSPLVSELLDELVHAIAADATPGARQAAHRRLVVAHPLQSFALAGFVDGDEPRVRSHDAETAAAWRHRLGAPPLAAATDPAAAMAGQAGAADDDAEPDADDDIADGAAEPDDDTPGSPFAGAPFFTRPLVPPPPALRQWTPQRLARFFANPCRALLRDRLGLVLPRDDDALGDAEPFVADTRTLRALAQRLLPARLEGTADAPLQALARAGTELPDGAVGQAQLEDAWPGWAAFAARVQSALAEPVLPPVQGRHSVDIEGEPWQLDMQWADLRAGGLVRWRPGPLWVSELLHAWAQHLALCTLRPDGVALHTRWLALDSELALGPVADAAGHLRTLLRLCRHGLMAPLPFYPRAAWALVGPKGSPYRARQAWLPRGGRAGAAHPESADPAYRLALRGVADPLAGDFAAVAEAVFGPLADHALIDGTACRTIP